MTAQHISETFTSPDTLCGLPKAPGTTWSTPTVDGYLPLPERDDWCLTCLHRHRALNSEPTDAVMQPDKTPGPEHALPDLPTHADIDRLLAQAQRDRDTAYWGTGDRLQQLDGVESWLLSLRDWLPA